MPELGTTYTSPQGPLQDRITNLQSQVTSQIQGAPAVQEQVGEQMLATEGSIQPLAEDRGKLIERLFSADKELAGRYATPESEFYIENPMAREAAVSGAENKIWGAVSALNTQIGARKQVLGDAIDRGMRIYQAGLTAKQFELDNLYKQLELNDRAADRAEKKRQFEEELKLKQLTAGARSPLNSTQQLEVSRWDAALEQAGRVLQTYKRARPKVGPLYGSIAKLPIASKFEQLRDPDLGALQVSITPLRLQVMNALIGSQMSEQEIEQVMKMMPDIAETPVAFDDKLRGLFSYLSTRRDTILARAGATETDQVAGSGFTPEAEEIMAEGF